MKYHLTNSLLSLALLAWLVAACAGPAGTTAEMTPTSPPEPAAPLAATAPASPTAQAATAQAIIPITSTGTAEAQTPAAAAPTQAVAAAACSRPADLTPALTEGPYFKSGSPERTSLLANGMPGTHLTLTGQVLTADCTPVANARLEFWQANSSGNYDNSGFTLRGHQFTDASGHYQLETVVPGEYPGRTEHIHVKVQAHNGPTLTTQLFFPGVADNQSDSIYDPKLLLPVQTTGSGLSAAYNFIIATQ